MDQQQQSRGQPTRRELLWAGGIAALAFLFIVICGYLFGWKWTGFPERTFWNWLDLLIVPIVLAIGGYLFTRSENHASREIEIRRRQEEILQAYVDQMLQLVTDKQLLQQTHWSSDVRSNARVRTRTTLRRLDKAYQRDVLGFLHEAQLINRLDLFAEGPDGTQNRLPARIVDLSGADLRGADLRYITLNGAALNGAILENADLRNTDLSGIDLGGCYLSGADLRDADLSRASLVNAELQRKDELSLESADLTGANLYEADLSGADLSNARLRRALLANADLQRKDERMLNGADLTGADLTEAHLRGADLSGALGISNEEVERQASSLEGATMPNGQKYEDWREDKEGRKERPEDE